MLLTVKLSTYSNGNILMNINTPTAQIQTGDYIIIQNKKYYIQAPYVDGNYRLYKNNTFLDDDFYNIIAQGDTNLYITCQKLTISYINDIINYGLSLRGIEYGDWGGNEPEIGEPMWATDEPSPPKDEIRKCNCAGLVNLMLRHAGIKIPYLNSTGRGGTMAYYYYYQSVSKPFDINQLYPEGTLFIRNFRNIHDQGHVAILLSNRNVLQSIPSEGINSNYTLEKSYDDNNYECAVLPQDWLNSLYLESAKRSEDTAIAQRTADFYAAAAEEAKARFIAAEQNYRKCPQKQQLDALHAARAAHEDAQKDAIRTDEYLRSWSAFVARGEGH